MIQLGGVFRLRGEVSRVFPRGVEEEDRMEEVVHSVRRSVFRCRSVQVCSAESVWVQVLRASCTPLCEAVCEPNLSIKTDLVSQEPKVPLLRITTSLSPVAATCEKVLFASREGQVT